ncbi:MAG: ABC transporter permease [Burkholderiales bacterium]
MVRDLLDRFLSDANREKLERWAEILWLDLRLGLRNVTRQTRRSALGLIAVVIGVVALILAAGFFEWNYNAMREGMIQARLGHAQVVKKGYFESGSSDPFAFLLPESTDDRTLIEAAPHVAAVAPRLSFNGLISRGDATIAFMGQGVDPEREGKLSGAIKIIDGEGLSKIDAKEVILGKGLAENLGAKVGQTVVLLASTVTRGVSAVEVKVAGIFVTSAKAYDDYALRLPLKTSQELLRVKGVHAWIVLLDRTDKTDDFVERVGPKLKATDIDFLPWHALPEADFYNKTVALFGKQMGFLRFLVSVIIVLSISNTLMNNVRERIGEIGTCMALGDTSAIVRRRFMVEGAMMGFVGGLVGVIAGTIAGIVVDRIGIPMPPPPGMSIGYTAGIRLTFGIGLGSLALASLTAFIAGIYPAWSASRLPIVDALRHAR